MVSTSGSTGELNTPPCGSAFEVKRFVGIGQLKEDKELKVSTYNNYVRDVENLMRIPVLDESDPND